MLVALGDEDGIFVYANLWYGNVLKFIRDVRDRKLEAVCKLLKNRAEEQGFDTLSSILQKQLPEGEPCAVIDGIVAALKATE